MDASAAEHAGLPSIVIAVTRQPPVGDNQPDSYADEKTVEEAEVERKISTK